MMEPPEVTALVKGKWLRELLEDDECGLCCDGVPPCVLVLVCRELYRSAAACPAIHHQQHQHPHTLQEEEEEDTDDA